MMCSNRLFKIIETFKNRDGENINILNVKSHLDAELIKFILGEEYNNN